LVDNPPMRVGLGLAVWLFLGCGGAPAGSTTTPTGAGSNTPPKASPEVEVQLGKMSEYRDRMCACHDKACVEQVAADMGAWSEKQAKKYTGHEPVPSDEQKERMAQISAKLGTCMTEATTPAPEAPSEPAPSEPAPEPAPESVPASP
jgi:hypothetical protein